MKNKKLPPFYFFIFILITGISSFFLRQQTIIVYPYNLSGLLPLIAGIILNLVADKQFKEFSTTVKPFEKPSALIDKGIYSISRNPMYIGMFLIISGIALTLSSLISLVLPVIFIFLMKKIFIDAEEKSLIETFGEKYKDYCSKTRRFI